MAHVKGFLNDKNGELTGYTSDNPSGYILDVIVSPNAKRLIKKVSEEKMVLPQEIVVGLMQKSLSESDIDENEFDSNISLMSFKNIALGILIVFDYPKIQGLILNNVETMMIENAVSKNAKSLDLGWSTINFLNKGFTHLGMYSYNLKG